MSRVNTETNTTDTDTPPIWFILPLLVIGLIVLSIYSVFGLLPQQISKRLKNLRT